MVPNRSLIDGSIAVSAASDSLLVSNVGELDLGSHRLTLNGNGTISGNVVIDTTYDGPNKRGGHIHVTGKENVLDMSGVKSMTVNITDNTLLTDSINHVYSLFHGVQGAEVKLMADDLVKVINPDPFTKWTYKEGKLYQIHRPADGLITIVTAAGGSIKDLANFLKVANPRNSAAAQKFLSDLEKLANKDPKKAADAVNKLLKATNPTAETALNTAKEANAIIAILRIKGADTFRFRLAEGEVQGVSAGDNDSTRYGIWTSPFYSKTNQKSLGGAPGSKSQAYGGIVGFDTKLNDDLMLGLALSVINTKVDYKDVKFGDKSKIETLMLSIYGLRELQNNWFLQGIVSFGTSSVKNNKVRVALNDTEGAHSKYDSMTYSGELLAGYNYQLASSMILTPMGGGRYSRFGDSGYTETGTANQNLTVNKKSTDRLEAIIGAKVTMMTQMNEVTVTPELRAFINHNFRGKSPLVTTNLDGMVEPIITRIAKPPKTYFNLGAGLSFHYHMMEYGMNYDASLAKKYIGHQGTIKIRVNF